MQSRSLVTPVCYMHVAARRLNELQEHTPLQSCWYLVTQQAQLMHECISSCDCCNAVDMAPKELLCAGPMPCSSCCCAYLLHLQVLCVLQRQQHKYTLAGGELLVAPGVLHNSQHANIQSGCCEKCVLHMQGKNRQLATLALDA